MVSKEVGLGPPWKAALNGLSLARSVGLWYRNEGAISENRHEIKSRIIEIDHLHIIQRERR